MTPQTILILLCAAEAVLLLIRLSIGGSGRLGRPKGSICPMDTYSSSAEKMAETISSRFFRRSSISSGSSSALTGAASGLS